MRARPRAARRGHGGVGDGRHAGSFTRRVQAVSLSRSAGGKSDRSAIRSSSGTSTVTPALLTSPSRRPHRCSAAATRAAAVPESPMSPWTYTASASSAAMRWPASAEDAELTTIPAPRPERRRATAAPMPLDDPVMMTALPGRSIPVPLQLAEVRSAASLVHSRPPGRLRGWLRGGPARAFCCAGGRRADARLHRAEPAGRIRAEDGPGPALGSCGPGRRPMSPPCHCLRSPVFVMPA